jgi:hypothetical protein
LLLNAKGLSGSAFQCFRKQPEFDFDQFGCGEAVVIEIRIRRRDSHA